MPRWNRCSVCQREYNAADPLARPPTCSESCWRFWTHIIDHSKEPCWIPGCLEVSCGVITPGYCWQCEIFITKEVLRERGIDKNRLIGNY